MVCELQTSSPEFPSVPVLPAVPPKFTVSIPSSQEGFFCHIFQVVLSFVWYFPFSKDIRFAQCMSVLSVLQPPHTIVPLRSFKSSSFPFYSLELLPEYTAGKINILFTDSNLASNLAVTGCLSPLPFLSSCSYCSSPSAAAPSAFAVQQLNCVCLFRLG